MGEPVKVGKLIPLSLQLSDEVTNAFVEANVFDADKVELVSSPVELVHDKTGHYIDNSIVYPFTDRIFAIIRVFTDNTKSKRHPRHRNTIEDIFPKLEERSIIVDDIFLNGIISSETLIGEIVDSSESLSGIIVDQENLSGEITEEILTGSIEEKETISGEINEDTIDGVLED